VARCAADGCDHTKRQGEERLGLAAALLRIDLAQEVLDSRPQEERDFLLRSSVLGEFCAEMCDAALKRADSRGMIAQIVRGNLLMASIDAKERWFRYHPLFADFLRARMGNEAPAEMQDLHRRAAKWAAAQGLMSEAVAHALAALDYALAADLLASSAMDMVRSGRVADTARAIARLPEKEVVRRPDLLRAAAYAAIFAHRYGDATHFIEAIARADHGKRGTSDEEIAGMRLMLSGWTDKIPELLETVAAMRSDTSRFGPFTAGLASNAGAYCHIALGRYVEAEQDIARARQAQCALCLELQHLLCGRNRTDCWQYRRSAHDTRRRAGSGDRGGTKVRQFRRSSRNLSR